MFGRPKRTVPPPEVVTSHQSDNPMFSPPPSPELQRFRRRVLSIVGALIILLLTAVATYGPWLRITVVEVSGTRALNPNSVKAVASTYLDGRSWLVFPRRNLWFLSGQRLGSYLKQKISTKLSIEAVNVTKDYPRRLLVNVVERTPVLLWTNGQDIATLDRQGVLIELRDQPDPALDTVRDGLAMPIQPDQRVIVPEVAAKILELQSALGRNNFTVKEYIIPTPVCPLTVPEPETTTRVNANDDANANSGDQNLNAPLPENSNVNRVAPLLVAKPCDLLPLRQKSQEIHVQLADGALVLFDRHANLEVAVTTLTRLLSQPENIKATYIDVRFEERVYIR